MPSPTGLSVPASFLRVEGKVGGRVFSPGDVEPILGRGMKTYAELARLVDLGWLFRISRGRYATVDPIVRLTPPMETGLRPFRSRCWFPILQRSAGEILRLFSGRLLGMALFGSAARGTAGPSSDLDLLVLLTSRPESVYEEARERSRVGRGSASVRVAENEATGHFHLVGLLEAVPDDFERPAPVLFDLPRDARILYDPDGTLARSLRLLSTLLRRHGGRRVVPATGESYWDLGTSLELPA